MAAININTLAPQAFEAGGVLTIDDGTDVATVLNIEPGTMKIKPGGYEAREYSDRMEQSQALEGMERYTEIEFDAKVADYNTAKNLRTMSMARGTNGVVAEHTVTIKSPRNKSATVGTQAVFATTYFPDVVEIIPGTQFDLYRVRLRSRDPVGTWTAYS